MTFVPSLLMSNKTCNLHIISQIQFASPHTSIFNIVVKPQQYKINFNEIMMPSIKIMRIWYSSGGTPGNPSETWGLATFFIVCATLNYTFM